MKFRAVLSHAAMSGLVFWGVLFVLEAVWVLADSPDLPWWSALPYVGAAAPVALVGTGLWAMLSAMWQVAHLERGAPGGNLVSRVRAWCWPDDRGLARWRSAWLLALGPLLGAWTGLNVWLGMRIDQAVATEGLGALLTLVAAVLSGAALALVSIAVVWPLAVALGWLARRSAIWRRMTMPAWILAGWAVAGLGALGGLWAVAPETMEALPWQYALAPTGALAAVALWKSAAWRWSALEARSGWLVAVLGTLLVALGSLAAWLPEAMQPSRKAFVDQPTLASLWFAGLEGLLDVDGDGTIHLYGGGDCRPFDRKIGPGQPEIPDDGIDQNCSGADLKVNVAAFQGGKPFHALAPGRIAPRPHIVLVTTDALSHGHTSLGGYVRDTTPELARWASQATVFASAFSTSTSTRLALPGLLASAFNSMMPLKDGRIHPYHYEDEALTLAEVLKSRGYRTVHIPGGQYFVRWKGYTQGFDVVDAKPVRTAQDKGHTAPELTEAALGYIAEHAGADAKPLFLWVHYFDHHGPYDVPKGAEAFGTDKIDRYDSELRFADRHWGRLFDALGTTWPKERYVALFTSDHGEAFDANHVRHHHDQSVRTAVLHVPLVIQGPHGRGRRVGGLASHLDVLPTLANLVGYPPAEEWLGESLVPVLFDGAEPQKSVLYSLYYIPEDRKRGLDPFQMIGVRTPQWYFFEERRRGNRMLVSWRADVLERTDHSAREPETAELYRYLAARKLEWLRAHERALKPFARGGAQP